MINTYIGLYQLDPITGGSRKESYVDLTGAKEGVNYDLDSGGEEDVNDIYVKMLECVEDPMSSIEKMSILPPGSLGPPGPYLSSHCKNLRKWYSATCIAAALAHSVLYAVSQLTFCHSAAVSPSGTLFPSGFFASSIHAISYSSCSTGSHLTRTSRPLFRSL